ncbi:MAG TPA: hypothetical protein VL943_05590 [Niabella sp.]|nr:hypothetical protein [Niabella sp.]
MKYLILSLSVVLFFKTSRAQRDVWTAYWNADTTLYGFKNGGRQVMIEPRFSGAGIARKWEHIMSVIEESPATGKWSAYFLTRTGKKTGFDSLYFFDNVPDCESEGFIRFSDRQLDKVGLLNRNGEVVVPAIYNYLDRVQNGLLTGLTGAQKKSDGEHYYWEGGETVLLDTAGKILIRSFAAPYSINLYSMKRSDQVVDDPVRINYKAVDGRYYSFIDYEKEFAGWLKKLVSTLDADILKQYVFDKVSYYTEQDGWVFKNGASFIDKNYPVLKATLQKLQQPSCDSFITREGLNPFIYESKEYEEYFDNCNQAKEWKYPQMSIYINHSGKGKINYQEGLDFLRTDKGYKLIHVNIKKASFR